MILVLLSREDSPLSCINSKHVRSLDISPALKVFNCALKSDIEGDITSSSLKELRQAQSTITTIENFLSANGLLLNSPTAPTLNLKYSKAMASNLLVEYLTQENSESAPIQRAIVSDVLEKVIFGITHTDHFISDSYVFVSERTACERGMVIYTQNSYCDLFKDNVIQAKSFDSLSHWSLRSMIYSQFLIKYYSSSIAIKKQLILSVVENFKKAKYIDVSEIGFHNFDRVHEKLSVIMLGDYTRPKPLPYIFKLEFFYPVQSLTYYAQKWSLRPNGLYYHSGRYHTSYGQIVADYSSKIPVQREIWIVNKLPTLKTLEKTGRERIELYTSQGTYLRVHIPSISMMFKLNIAKPIQGVDSVNTKNATAWLGFNPIEKM